MVECGHQKLSGLNFNLLFLLLKMKNSITTDDRCRINLWAEHGGCGATDRCNCRDQVRGFPVKTKCDLNLLSKKENTDKRWLVQCKDLLYFTKDTKDLLRHNFT